MYYLRTLLFSDTPLLYYYINLRSSIIACLCCGDIYLYLGVSLSCSTFSALFVTSPKLLYGEAIETLYFY